MLIEADSLDRGTHLAADVCIIGAGAAGITLALELTAAGHEVLLIESGGRAEEIPTQDLAAGTSIGNPSTTLDSPVRLDQMRLRYLGGTTNHWAGFCRPLSPVDFEVRDHLAVSGWPIAFTDLDPYMARAAEWVRISGADFDLDRWQQRLGLQALDLNSERVESFVYQLTFPTKFGEVYRSELTSTENLRVLLHANVVNIATQTGNHVSGLDLRTLGGKQIHAEATAYVLATGGIENPRLLLSSTDHDPAGLGNTNDLVGRYFTEHLQVYAGFGVLDTDPAGMVGFQGADVTIEGGRHAGSTHHAKFALGLTDAHVRDEATTGLEIQLLTGTYPLGVPLQQDGATLTDVAGLLGREGIEPRATFYLQGLAEQELNRDSRVLLGRAADALGMRRVELDWRYSQADRQRALDGFRVAAEEIGAAGLGRVQLVPGGVHADAIDHLVPGEFISLYSSNPSAINEETFPIGMGFHHMCTTRMSADASTGVVNTDCRMHDVDNLWVGGSSVFSTGGVATPTYTLVALAVRLAEHLDEVLS